MLIDFHDSEPGTDPHKDRQFLKYSGGVSHIELIMAFCILVHFGLGPQTLPSQEGCCTDRWG